MKGHWGNVRFFVVPIFVLILMMTEITFSQTVMEIYAYNFISKRQNEKVYIEKTFKGKNSIKNTKSKNNNTKEKQIKVRNADDKTQKSKESVSKAFSFIVPVEGGVTSSYFGDKVDRTSSHKGHDWAVPSGTSVKASEKGVVKRAYYSESYGYNVLIQHSDDLETRYAHMSALYVEEGENVKRGQVLGLSGNTGDSTGPHLHFEVIKNGNKINPLSLLNK